MPNKNTQTKNLRIEYVPIDTLKAADYNPRKWDEEALKRLKESLTQFGVVDPLLVNGAKNRNNVVIGGHMRLSVMKELGLKEAPVIYLNIPDIEQEKSLNIRLNKATGDWDWDLLAEFDEAFLSDVGFSSEEMDEIFPVEETPEQFDLEKELKKLKIENIEIQKGDIWEIGEHRFMCGSSTSHEDVLALMGGEKADMCFTDPPYILDYLRGKKKSGKATEGFGLKRDRRYLETDELPPDFTELWMANIAEIQQPNFSIIVFENPKNLRIIWNALENHWKYRNTIIWHIPNRVQGFAAKYKFFNKHDFAIVGTLGDVELNENPEEDLLQNEYETALFATSGSPHWENYKKGKKYNPTDFIDYKAADEKSSGQGIIFGTKPVEILLPYLKVLTKRDQIVIEPFGGSGSTMAAAEMLKRRCFLMEKSPVYAEVIRNRLEKLTGLTARKIHGK